MYNSFNYTTSSIERCFDGNSLWNRSINPNEVTNGPRARSVFSGNFNEVPSSLVFWTTYGLSFDIRYSIVNDKRTIA